MNKVALLTGGAVGAVGVAVLTGTAFAASNNGNGYGYTAQLETKAQTLQMTSDQLREQLKTKTLYQIAEDKGVSVDKLHAAVASQAEQRWRDMGLTDDQINERKQQMAERQADCDGTGSHQGTGQGTGMGMHRGLAQE